MYWSKKDCSLFRSSSTLGKYVTERRNLFVRLLSPYCEQPEAPLDQRPRANTDEGILKNTKHVGREETYVLRSHEAFSSPSRFKALGGWIKFFIFGFLSVWFWRDFGLGHNPYLAAQLIGRSGDHRTRQKASESSAVDQSDNHVVKFWNKKKNYRFHGESVASAEEEGDCA